MDKLQHKKEGTKEVKILEKYLNKVRSKFNSCDPEKPTNSCEVYYEAFESLYKLKYEIKNDYQLVLKMIGFYFSVSPSFQRFIALNRDESYRLRQIETQSFQGELSKHIIGGFNHPRSFQDLSLKKKFYKDLLEEEKKSEFVTNPSFPVDVDIEEKNNIRFAELLKEHLDVVLEDFADELDLDFSDEKVREFGLAVEKEIKAGNLWGVHTQIKGLDIHNKWDDKSQSALQFLGCLPSESIDLLKLRGDRTDQFTNDEFILRKAL